MRAVFRLAMSMIFWLSGSDTRRLWLVKRLAFTGKPKAARAFGHYLTGGGETLEIETGALLREDAGVRRALLTKLYDAIAAGQTRGRIAVDQRYAADRDWRFAVGSVAFDWWCVGSQIELKAVGQYRWHPRQRRISQAVHRLAERMREQGARPFAVIGKQTRIAMAELRPGVAQPIHAYLL